MALSAKDKRALTVCGSFLAVVFGYMGLVDPIVLRYEDARRTIEELDEKLVALRRKKKLLRPRQRKLASTRLEVDELLERYGGIVERERRQSVCIGDFQRCATAAGVTLHSIRPLPVTETTHAAFDDYRFELDFSGPYDAVLGMLYRLEGGRSLQRTRQFQLKAEKRAVRCRLVALRSFFEGLAPPPAVEEEEDGDG